MSSWERRWRRHLTALLRELVKQITTENVRSGEMVQVDQFSGTYGRMHEIKYE
jgi:hypothetical protein